MFPKVERLLVDDFKQVLVQQHLIDPPRPGDEPIPCAAFEIVDGTEATFIEQVLHHENVHPHRSASDSIAIADLEESIDFGQNSRAIALEGFSGVVKVCRSEFCQSVHFQSRDLFGDESIILRFQEGRTRLATGSIKLHASR